MLKILFCLLMQKVTFCVTSHHNKPCQTGLGTTNVALDSKTGDAWFQIGQGLSSVTFHSTLNSTPLGTFLLCHLFKSSDTNMDRFRYQIH